MSDIIHTTKSAAEYIQRRYGIQVQVRTVKQWCNRERLAGAYHIGEGKRGFWQIAESGIDKLIKSKKEKIAQRIAHNERKGPEEKSGIGD